MVRGESGGTRDEELGICLQSYCKKNSKCNTFSTCCVRCPVQLSVALQLMQKNTMAQISGPKICHSAVNAKGVIRYCIVTCREAKHLLRA